MKKLLIYLVSIAICLIVIISIFFSQPIYESNTISYLRSKIPLNLKDVFLKKILVYKYISVLENKINQKDQVIAEKNRLISELNKSEEFLFKTEKTIGKKLINIKYFKNNNFQNYGPRAYFAKNSKNLFLISGTGNTYYTNINNLNNNEVTKIIFSKIESNFSEIVGEEYIFNNMTITKGAEIIEEKLYLSLVKKNNEECYSNVIFVALINANYLKFENFFDTKMCLPYFDNSSGGNIAKYKDDKILITIGDWVWANEDLFPKESKLNPQNPNDYLGKILSINLNNSNDVKLMALGTRNSQGLYYDDTKDLIYFSDHGPQGGDEINVIKPDDNQPNFGWPIASYGEHYGYPKNKNKKQYERAPLKKPHSKYNFIEPIKFFPDASPATTQVIVSNNFEKYSKKLNALYLATLGDSNIGSKSVHKFVLNDNLNIIEEDVYYINERVRDMIYVEEVNKIVLYLETTGSIAILSSTN